MKKVSILGQNIIYIFDLDVFFGVQVSVCIGVVWWVWLWDLFVDIVLVYVIGFVMKLLLWKLFFL